ncbi:hypothetical protein KOY_00688 [Bacillus cereus VDM021]|nr:hypothetical protein IIW_00735 [Bacillus cereus VD136]EOP74314.1 hypothetical protein KOW_00066 [Bacillus cereus VDM006]EOQ11912.1 hypothetical protein KOY_00688 [Bacillus cereus VDM021]OOG91350.1 hypothetical protein BTH41_01651 [Bacillus mycoides]
MNEKQSICEVYRKNDKVFENTYSMMVVSYKLRKQMNLKHLIVN